MWWGDMFEWANLYNYVNGKFRAYPWLRFYFAYLLEMGMLSWKEFYYQDGD